MTHFRRMTQAGLLVVAAISAFAQQPPQPPQPAQQPQPPQSPQLAAPPRPVAPRALTDGVGGGIGAGVGVRPVVSYSYSYSGSDDSQYQVGQTALDNRRWDQALASFTQVASRNGSHAEGALYWKAYTLNKLGRRDEALAAIAELRKSFPSGRWLEDAKALEVEVRQASGQSVAPESDSDEDLRLLALNGLMQTFPERALPLVENLLKGNQSPKLKKRAIFVISQNTTPRAQELLEQVIRGSVNPDLQVVAIRYYAQRKQDRINSGLLWETYNSSNDVTVKREILNTFSTLPNRDLLVQLAKTEKSSELRLLAIRSIGRLAGTSDTLVSIYGSEQDAQVKQAVLESLRSQNNAAALVTLARAERDPQAKMKIVQYLVNMKTPEASDYLLELLK